MINQRYVTPAVVAAAFHVALLFGFVPCTPEISISTPTRVRKHPPERPPEPIELVPPVTTNEPVPAAEPVKPIRGDPPPPDLAEPPPTITSDIAMSADEFKPQFASVTNTKVPPIVGDPDGEITGVRLNHMPAVFDSDKLDRMPLARVQASPAYPYGLRQTGIEGTVLVEFQVDVTGQVVTARVLRSDHREFEEPTLRAVMKWRFEPGRRSGKVVPFRMQIPVDFHLNQE